MESINSLKNILKSSVKEKSNWVVFLFWLTFLFLILFFSALIIVIIVKIHTTTPIKGILKREIFFSIKLSFLTAFLSSLIAVIISIPIAFILTRYKFPFKNIVEILLYLPVVVPPVALGAMLLIFFQTPMGNFFERNFFNVVYEVPGLILAQTVVAFGISVNVIKVFFNSVKPIYEDVARTLGATKIQAFLKILLPLSKKGILAAFFLSFARALGEFGASVMLAGATTMKTETLPIAIFLNFSSADVYGASVFILVTLIVSLGVLFIIKNYAESK